MMKSYKRIVALVAIVITVVAFISNAYPVHAANYAIKNNGLNGVYIDINSSPFTSTEKRMASLKRACTWFVSARVKQLTGVYPEINGGQWWWKQANTKNGYYGFKAISGNPVGKTVVCYTNHVSVIEAYDGNVYTISEGGNGKGKASEKYCQITTRTLSQIKNLGGSSGKFLGFVYLGIPFEKKNTESTKKEVVSYAKSFTLSDSSIQMYIGDTYQLNATLNPSNAVDKVLWSSSDPSVVTVNDGRITAVNKGTATIKAAFANDNGYFWSNCTVTVTEKETARPQSVSYAKSFTLSDSSIQIYVGDTYQLNAALNPSDAVDKVLWSSSDPSVVTVNDGRVTAVNKGSAKIKAEFANDSGYFWSNCTVTVNEKVSGSEAAIDTITAIPTDISDSSDVSSLEDNYLMEENSVSSITDPATETEQRYEQEGEVNQSKTVYAKDIYLDKSSIQMNAGETGCINATIYPIDATENTVFWSSSDESVVVVENGTLKAVGEGTAIITASLSHAFADGNWYETCTIYVSSTEQSCNNIYECTTNSDGSYRLKEGKYKAPRLTALETVWYEGENIVSTYGDRNKIFAPCGYNEYRYYEDGCSYTITVTSSTSYTYVIRNEETNAIRMRLFYEYLG